MADITITVPNGDVLDTLVAAADEYLIAKEVDISSMTVAQRGRRYIAMVMREVYIRRKRQGAETTAKATVDSTEATATTDAGGIV
jgi:hypothetical protein